MGNFNVHMSLSSKDLEVHSLVPLCYLVEYTTENNRLRFAVGNNGASPTQESGSLNAMGCANSDLVFA